MGFENGRVLRAVFRASRAGDQQVNVLHYDLEDGSWPTHDNDPQTLATLLGGTPRTKWALMYNASWQVDPVVVVEERDPQNPFAPRSTWQGGTPGPGTKAAASTGLMPRACNVCCTLRSTHIGRRYTGRLFAGGSLLEAEQEDGIWGASPIAAVQAFLDAVPREPDLIPAADTGSAKWSVYSRKNREQDRDPYLSAIQSYSVNSPVRWRRSREG